ncbi:MAG TPA: GDP-mannose 4,6-dehydratase, partial [Candidatus Udaeobacter sp.]|nr:GDP-mannose 4,6-dehydratase [Candidatus Udaeobacter sp.]
SREIGAPPITGIGIGPLPDGGPLGLKYHNGDVTDFGFVSRVVSAARPEQVIHLAALTFGRPAGPEDQRFLTVNVQGTRVLLEALLAQGLRPRVLVASSSAVYGAAQDDPITEDTPIHPQTLYAASKACQELIAQTYQYGGGLEVIVTRAFNHTGPGEHEHFAASTFARQVAAAEAGRTEPVIRVGNLSAYRDFTDVRDIVRAYCAVLERGQAGAVYNVCSGRATQISELLDILLGMAKRPLTTEIDPARLAPADVPYQRGSHERLTAATGWQPAIPLATTLADLLDYWRAREQGGRE